MSLIQSNNFKTRTITGILFVAVIVACVFTHKYSFFALVFTITFFCLREFYQLTLEKGQGGFNNYVLLIGMLPVVLYILSFDSYEPLDRIIGIISGITFVLFFLTLFLQLPYNSDRPFTNLSFAVLGWFYVCGAMLFFLLNSTKFIAATYNPKLAILFFILVWINDTGAYLVGSTLGRTKLLERVSPKKTWEGTIGGIVFCILTGAAYGHLVLHESALIFAGLGLVIGIFSTLGDLLESQLKRSLGIKDSGTMLPGHGGFLDRFDGFLMAMPAAFFYMMLVKLLIRN